MRGQSPHILMTAPQAAPCAGGCYGLRVDQENEQRYESAAGDENAHASKVGRLCFEPVSSS
jgi:hypothetical protein